jgi:hypothetical protein
MAYVSYDSAADTMSYDSAGGQEIAAADPPADTGPWTRLNNWGTETMEAAQAALVSIANNPDGSYANGNFGANNWRAVDGGDGWFYLEFQPK